MWTGSKSSERTETKERREAKVAREAREELERGTRGRGRGEGERGALRRKDENERKQRERNEPQVSRRRRFVDFVLLPRCSSRSASRPIAVIPLLARSLATMSAIRQPCWRRRWRRGGGGFCLGAGGERQPRRSRESGREREGRPVCGGASHRIATLFPSGGRSTAETRAAPRRALPRRRCGAARRGGGTRARQPAARKDAATAGEMLGFA